MRLLIPFLLLSVITFSQTSKMEETSYYFPAEWEPHRAMIVNFDHELTADSVSTNMVKALSSTMKVYCMITADSMVPYYKNWFRAENINMDSVQFILYGSYIYSIRDPVCFLRNENHDLKIMNFKWNFWGFLPDSIYVKDFLGWSAWDKKNFDSTFSTNFPFPTVKSDMILEGGAIEVNGEGTLLQVESLNMHRNPTMPKGAQETELKKVLGVKKIIWLKEGPADDPDHFKRIEGDYFGEGVYGHVDEFCRFATAKTVFLSYPEIADTINNPVGKITFERMRTNYEILQNATDMNGKHFEIVKFPIPDFDPTKYILDSSSTRDEITDFSKRVMHAYKNFKKGDTCYFAPTGSYLNYLVTNDKVLIPEYWKEGKPTSMKLKDEKVRKLFEKYFPGRRIIQINPTGLNFRGGGMHCWSQQIPK